MQTDAQSVMSRSSALQDDRQHIHTILHSVLDGPMAMRTCVFDFIRDVTSS